jgi:acetyl-CoA synthetase
MDRTTGQAAYRAVRDMLVRHRDAYVEAVAAFRWPDIEDRFNCALEWFDPVAARNPQTALRIIGEDGTDRSYSFAEMAARSDRLATSLAAGGVGPGDRVIIMLGNQVELWESMPAVVKLGAVSMPATSALKICPSSWKACSSSTRRWPRRRWCRPPTQPGWPYPRLISA